MAVLILTGPPGAGKTTVAELLAGRHDRSVHLEGDRFLHFIRSGYIEPWRPESRRQNETVIRIVATAAAGYAEAGYFTIIDGIVLPRWSLGPARELLASNGQTVAYVVLRASLETCLARAERRAEARFENRAVIEQLHRDFADLGALEGHALDTGSASPAQIADRIDSDLEALVL